MAVGLLAKRCFQAMDYMEGMDNMERNGMTHVSSIVSMPSV